MGHGKYTENSFKSYSTLKKYGEKTTAQIFDQSKLHKTMDPKGVIRESRDSVDNPESTPIILAIDVTGSMGPVLGEIMAKKGAVDTLCNEVLTRKPITDPHLMCMGIGDAEIDSSPLQVSQFEADTRILEQLEKVWLERGGGGNSYEGYTLAWYFAAHKIVADCFDVRKKKGYLFTVGDEYPNPKLYRHDLVRIFGDSEVGTDIESKDLLELVLKKFHVFHVVVEQGNFAKGNSDLVVNKWNDLIGQRVIRLKNKDKLAETIVASIQMNEGMSPEDVIKSWNDPTGSVKDALKGLGNRVISL